MFRQALVEVLEGRRLLTSAFPIGIGSSGADFADSIASDRLNNVIVVGTLAAATDVDTGAGTVTVPAGGFVAKYDASGTLIWGRQFPGTTITKVATDGGNSVYVVGSYSGTVDVDPRKGVHNLTSVGGTDAFICKLSTNGNFQLAASVGGKGDDVAEALAVDSAGNMFIGGTFKARANFDPNGAFSIGNSGGTDGFIDALDANGAFRWAGSFGGPGDDNTTDLAVDDSGNVVGTGRYLGDVDFNPGKAVSSANVAGTLQSYVLKWDSTGAFVFGDGFGGTGVTFGSAVTVDRDGTVYSTGNFTGTADFDPTGGTFNLIAPATGLVYVDKLSPTGLLIYAKSLGGSASQDIGPGEIAVDKGRNVYVSGTFSGTQDFNPGPGTSNLTSAGQNDIFTAKLDSSGGFVFATRQGGPLDDSSEGLVLDRDGNILTDGEFSDTANLGTDANVVNFTSNGDTDIFVSKVDSNGVLA